MSLYRVQVPVVVFVEINEDNLAPDDRVAFHGDTPKAAINRAAWSLIAKGRFNQTERETSKKFGIKTH
ncbi:MAG: hypothetical protein M3Y13_01670, partial [Armatimonadota bacterium]|nr:hypothetical protein [Armatimonadota bacterium]